MSSHSNTGIINEPVKVRVRQDDLGLTEGRSFFVSFSPVDPAETSSFWVSMNGTENARGLLAVLRDAHDLLALEIERYEGELEDAEKADHERAEEDFADQALTHPIGRD